MPYSFLGQKCVYIFFTVKNSTFEHFIIYFLKWINADNNIFYILPITWLLPDQVIPYVLQLILNRVLMLGSTSQTMIGRPVLPDASVLAVVEEHVRNPF